MHNMHVWLGVSGWMGVYVGDESVMAGKGGKNKYARA